MARELAISLYLFVFKCFFSFFNLFPLKDKTTFVISFGDNSKFIYEEMQRQHIQQDVIFLCTGQSIVKFDSYESIHKFPFGASHPFAWVRSIYHLATSKIIHVDNYFGFLAVTTFRENVQCIQLWHASGALKKFGFEDESIKNRTKKANERFLQVYQKFDKVIVGSDVMAKIFMKSFGLKQENILPTGVPRTDFFFNGNAKRKVIETFTTKFPVLQEKKVILYAPTYRDNQLDHFSLQLDLELMSRELENKFVLILRYHPAVKNTVDFTKKYPNFVYDFSSAHYEINDLLVITDYLITDYSSIPYDFSLLRRPMIFFTYDLEEYKQSRGVVEGLEENLPGPIAKDTISIIELIKNDRFDLSIIDRYTEIWNKYSKGHSSENLVWHLYKKGNEVQKEYC